MLKQIRDISQLLYTYMLMEFWSLIIFVQMVQINSLYLDFVTFQNDNAGHQTTQSHGKKIRL